MHINRCYYKCTRVSHKLLFFYLQSLDRCYSHPKKNISLTNSYEIIYKDAEQKQCITSHQSAVGPSLSVYDDYI